MCVVQRFTLDTCVKDRPGARFTRPATCMSPSKMSPLNVASKCHHFMSPFGRHLRGSRPSLKVSRNASFQTVFSWLSTHWLTKCLWQHAVPTSTACLLLGTPPARTPSRATLQQRHSVVSHEKCTPDCYATLNIALSGDHSATTWVKRSPEMVATKSPLGSNWRPFWQVTSPT